MVIEARLLALVGALAQARIVALGKVLARMATIRSRNSSSYFTFV